MSQDKLNDDLIYNEPLTGQLCVKDKQGNSHLFYPTIDTNDIQSSISNEIANLGLEFKYDQSDEPEPAIEEYTATDSESEDIITHEAYYYKINNGSDTRTPIETVSHKEGEIHSYQDVILAYSTTLPCTVIIGKNLIYKVSSNSNSTYYYYAQGGEQTVTITEAGTIHVEYLRNANIALGSPAPWQGFSTDLVVETNSQNSNLFKITATNFRFYTKKAIEKYLTWKNRSKETTLKLVYGVSTNKTADLSYLTDYIKSLENRIAALEARI